ALRDAQAGGAEPADELAARDGLGAEAHELVVALDGVVVMVVVEPAFGDSGTTRALVELGQRRVAHEVAPHGSVVGPDRRVDEHRHGAAATRWAAVVLGERTTRARGRTRNP